jgi:hypothetical protein
MVKKIPLQCSRMAALAMEYCSFIDAFKEHDGGVAYSNDGLMTLEKLLPRLHVAVTALMDLSESVHHYCFYDDDLRCELFLRLNAALRSDKRLWPAYEGGSLAQQSSQELCERMADDLADIYFDLKQGLELLRSNPRQAASHWQSSFYAHWGKHLLNAECWLRAVDVGGEPPRLPEWWWPNLPDVELSLV